VSDFEEIFFSKTYFLSLAEECQRNTGRATRPTVVVSSLMGLRDKYDAKVDSGLPKES